MKRLFVIGCGVISLMLMSYCGIKEENYELPEEEKWNSRLANLEPMDSLIEGKTYLSVYSHVFSISEHKVQNLTAIISLRNTSSSEEVFIKKADYYHTDGELIKSYINKPIYIKPMETVEIMIFEKDEQGGTGGNFIFDWATKNENNKPYFEGIMISTYGQLGLSFSTQGLELKQ